MSIYRMRTEFGKYLKPILYLIVLIFVVGAIWQFGAAPRGRDNMQSGDTTVVAKVNGEEVFQSEYDNMCKQAFEQYRQQRTLSPLGYAQLKSDIFQSLVQTKILLQTASKMGVDISETAVNAEADAYVLEYLKQNRIATLGDISKKQQALDPRDDKEYKKELAANDQSITELEDFARSRVPLDQIKVQLAQKGIVAKLQKGARPVSKKDIEDSFKTYNIRQIFLNIGKLPKEQLNTKAVKIAQEAKSGADFAKLARQNSDMPNKANGGLSQITYDSRFMYPPEVIDSIMKMKSGDISSPIDTDFGVFIVKLESITENTQKKPTDKEMDARKTAIKQDRQNSEIMRFSKSLTKNRKVEVYKPELKAYWSLYEAQLDSTNPDTFKKSLNSAIDSLTKALKDTSSPDIIKAKLAQLQFAVGKPDQTIRLLYPMLEGKTATTEGADLRILLGDAFMKSNDKAKAIAQYKVASEVGRDIQIHQQLIDKFKSIGETTLANSEKQWIDTFNQKQKEWEKRNSKSTQPKEQ